MYSKKQKIVIPTDVVKAKGRTDAIRTLKRVAGLIKKRTRDVEKTGWTVLKLVGMGAPGLYLKDGRVDPRTVPNIPGLAKITPAGFLENLLGNEWRVYVNNDGVVQAIAVVDAFVRSIDYNRKWSKIIDGTGGKVIYFGPGTGFGAGKVLVRQDRQVEPMPGSQAFFDILIRTGKTAEDLLGGYGIGKIAQFRERANLGEDKTVFLRFTEGYKDGDKDLDGVTESELSKISGKVVAKAFSSRDRVAKKMAREVFVQAGRDLAKLMIQLHEGKGKKKTLEWDKKDWLSVKGTRVFLAAGLLIKHAGKQVILPSARQVLKKEGYSKKIHIVASDQLSTMDHIKGKIGVFGASLMVPEHVIREKIRENFLLVGTNKINRYICDITQKAFLEKARPIILAMDGYGGIDWKKIIPQITGRLENAGVNITAIDAASFYKPPEEIDKMIPSDKKADKTFGRIFRGKLEDLLDENRINGLKERFEKYKKKPPKSPEAILCFGPGAACKPLRRLYDIIFYRDITREEITRRNKKGRVASFGASGKEGSGKGQPAYLAGKRLYYVDFPVLDKHKKNLQKQIHFYIDDNLPGKPKLMDQKILDETISHLAQGPIQLKAFHDAGVWGGQWLKKIRKLPREMVNCAWAYELMAYHMSVKIPVGDTFIEVPFANILDKEPDKIMGEQVNRLFKGVWPIRVNYDDCWQGGDMAIQIHPDAAYIKKQFNEPLHQDESYYILAATPDAYVHLGLKQGIDLSEFKDAVSKAEAHGIPFDHRKYVNVFPAKEGDLFLIPAGTVHASGKGCVVLELSATTDRYTFHFYDYLRPDLNGKLRDIHAKHAFNMVNKYPHRTTSWVKKHLLQKPRIIRKGKDWAEYLLGRKKEVVFEVYRFEFATTMEDNTKGLPHVLSMVKGDGVTIQSQVFHERQFHLNFSETVLLPACLGKYTIINRGDKPCKVLKTVVREQQKD
ncbi:MAG: class I mannose-6-phosphate isomerase [Deltaproteobacteria bacterium]|nr:class I mannose-6-phosphate isomerase [Deltaproteobacteria bacterium]